MWSGVVNRALGGQRFRGPRNGTVCFCDTQGMNILTHAQCPLPVSKRLRPEQVRLAVVTERRTRGHLSFDQHQPDHRWRAESLRAHFVARTP